MGRPSRGAEGGYVYHVLNRANARMKIFRKEADYEAFERILVEALDKFEMRLLSYCLMPNHWHFVLWPYGDGDLSRFVGWMTLTHTQRWHAHYQTIGTGHVYQGRFKSFPVQEDLHFLTVCRYAERNALRAGLVSRAEDWRWNSLWRWKFGSADEKSILSAWPVRRSAGWIDHVNQPISTAELKAIRLCVRRGNPYGDADWIANTVEKLGLESTLRPRGRPRIDTKGS